MNAILATGGLNDVAMEFGEVLDVGFFLLISGLLALSWWKHSLISIVIASFLALLEGLWLEPWTVLAPPSDLYDTYWVFRLRVICAVWLLLLIVAAVCWFRILLHRKQKKSSI